VYSLCGVGLVLIFSVVRIPNFAHGEAVMVGAMVPLILIGDHHVPLIAGLLAGVGAAIVLGAFLGFAVFGPLRRLPEVALLIVSLALVVIIEALAVKFWGDAPRTTPGEPSGVLSFLGARFTPIWAVIFVAAVGSAIGLEAYVRLTRSGRAMRAMALNPFAAMLMGIPVLRYQVLAFAVGSGLAGLAGTLYGLAFPVQSTMGALISLKSFIVIIFAGMGSITGALVGGLLLGIVESFGGTYISSGYRDTFGFLFLVAVLLLRPNGLFARANSA
jgi:branched-chain amino acid transport system permease protein